MNLNGITSIKILAAATAIIAVASCGDATPNEAEKQKRSTLELPDFNLAADPLQTLENGESQIYLGNILIWDKNPPIEEVEKIVENAALIRNSKADWMLFKNKNLIPAEQSVLGLRQDIRDAEKESISGPVIREAQRIAATTWFRTTMNSFVDDQTITIEQRIAADRVFDAYCEAKIWELGIYGLFNRQNGASEELMFNRRPSPVQLCERFYAENFFQDAKLCGPSAKGKSYFQCIWQEGILKTRFFDGRYEIPFEDAGCSGLKSERLLEWVKNGTFTEPLASGSPSSFPVKILNQKKLPRDVVSSECRKAFEPEGGYPRSSDTLTNLYYASPYMLIDATEDPNEYHREALQLVPWSELTPQAIETMKTFQNAIKLMSVRDGGIQSVSDYLYNYPTTVPQAPLELERIKSAPEYDHIFSAMDPKYKPIISGLNSQLADAEVKKDNFDKKAFEIQSIYVDLLNKTATAAGLTGVSSALFANSKLTVENFDGIFEIRYKLDDINGSTSFVCWDSYSKSQVACVSRGQSSSLQDDSKKITHEADTTKLELEFLLDDAQRFGFGLIGDQTAATPVSAQDVSGMIMRLTLYPNTLKDVLNIYSGDMVIVDLSGTEERIVHRGSVNMLTD
jgi:hypothetical protein